MKVVEFPKEPSAQDNIQDFLDEAKTTAEESSVTDAVIIMMNEDGEIGMMAAASPLDAIALVSVAFKSL